MAMTRDEYFMSKAIELAKECGKKGEVPVGAVIVMGNDVISYGKNARETGKNALYHAEIEAINNACKALGGWRLHKCELYVTLEPCPMCAGAIINSRIFRLVYGAYDKKSGSCGSLINLFDVPYNHKPIIISGVLEDECSFLLKEFFSDLRIKNRTK